MPNSFEEVCVTAPRMLIFAGAIQYLIDHPEKNTLNCLDRAIDYISENATKYGVKVMKALSLGKIHLEEDVAKKMRENPSFAKFVNLSLGKFSCYNWGNVSRDTKTKNDEAIENGGEVSGYYTFNKEKLRIVTAADRSSTTIMIPKQIDISNNDSNNSKEE